MTYVYATTLLRDRSRFRLGLGRLCPPGPERGWEVCAVSYTTDGLVVSWRCLRHVEAGASPLVSGSASPPAGGG